MAQASTAERAKPPRPAPDRDPSGSETSSRVADLGLIAAFLALTFLLGIFPLKDTDFWWHLKAGDLIRATGEVPRVDTFTYGAEGRPWVDLHWGFQVLLSWGYQHGGIVGLNLAKCALTTLAVLILITSRRKGWPVWVMLLAWIPALLVLSGRMYIRPETISLVYLSIVLAILFRWERKPWLAFALPVVQACWVNTQGLFLFGPILIGFALVDAAARPGAFAKGRLGWWRTVLTASALTGLACLLNPYGLSGALYPLQLAGTMGNPIFKNIGELKPLPTFIAEVGLDSPPLLFHLATFALGILGIALPMAWAGWVAIADRRTAKPEPSPEVARGKSKRETSKARKKVDAERAEVFGSWRPHLFRSLLFAAFSALSLAATRNSHQFAAVVGTVTAWNFGEWAAALRARKLRLHPDSATIRPRAWPKFAVFAAIALIFAAVASGRFYDWCGEGRTVGIGEEPLRFPHEAVKFAGAPGMPDRLVGFHNGHPSLYEYEWAPARKAYTDARLEVMGPDLYKKYIDLESKIANNKGDWAEELDAMNRPVVLVDNIENGNHRLSTTLLNSRHWRCVWFDPIVCLFVHDSNETIVRDHGVDFAARHFRREVEGMEGVDLASLGASAKILRNIVGECRYRGADDLARGLAPLGLDYARKIRAVDPDALDGWKQAGLIDFYREMTPSDEIIPRFRMGFDPVFDLGIARATYELSRALEIAPDEGIVQFSLASLFESRGMVEAAIPLLERFGRQPNKNLEQRKQKSRAASQAIILEAKMGRPPATKWENYSELERVVAELLATGRASRAVGVIEPAHRPEARPWPWADRLATLELHLGHPARAREAWRTASVDVPSAIRSARVAATHLVEGDFESARKNYRDALATDPNLFEARYGLALLEQDDGHAAEALAQARLAEKVATKDHGKVAAREIIRTVAPYVPMAGERP